MYFLFLLYFPHWKVYTDIETKWLQTILYLSFSGLFLVRTSYVKVNFKEIMMMIVIIIIIIIIIIISFELFTAGFSSWIFFPPIHLLKRYDYSSLIFIMLTSSVGILSSVPTRRRMAIFGNNFPTKFYDNFKNICH